MKRYIDAYLNETKQVLETVDRGSIEQVIRIVQKTKDAGGRLFILGVGGSSANASHAVNDFRKIAGLEAYTPVDNVSELTAWTNDAGFEYIFVNWLTTSRLDKKDAVMVFSVGGGTDTTSKNLVMAMKFAKRTGARIVSIVSRDGGSARKMSDACILIPVVNKGRITPHAEGWQAVISHLIVNAIR